MRVAGYRTPLRADHMLLMQIPRRFWAAKYVDIKHEKLKAVVERYFKHMHDLLDAGDGLLLWGSNGTGKTSAVVVIAKEARRRGAPVLFATAEDLRKADIEKTVFSDDMTLMERAREVEVLLIDDLGKEHRGQTGYANSLFENLMRKRSAERKTTFLTTNLDPGQLEDRYDKSMMEVLKETTVPVRVEGENLREQAQEDLRNKVAAG